MRWRAAPFLLLAPAAAGCASLPAAPQRRVQVEEVLSFAASQVRRCYRSPRIASEGRQIVTRLRVRYTADGQLAQLPVVVAQDGVNARNQPYAGRMAEAAIGAVLRCAPLRLPEGLPANGMIAFDLTFSPSAPA